ncbi:Lysosomal beta glucosidase [Phytophthora megakarya]|uniref:Lysosomal beta glucosidase n=1 Tax=Phytophthora megakarya TaxID=4795 RepID=A0A225WJQ8_9STRA|nr:Lysosomal beta glucosidase [Phytophthora megakarya]
MEKLQLDLHVLQRKKPNKGVQTLTAMHPATQKPNVWQERASRQRRRREQEECDNVRLKLAVDRQRKVADGLGVLNNECTSLINQCHTIQPTIYVSDFCGDVGAFRTLFCHLDEACRDLDSIFAATVTASLSVADDVHLREDVDGKYLEFFTNKDLPFGRQDTAQVSWDYFKGAEKHMASGNLYEKSAKNLDDPFIIIEELTKEVYSNNFTGDMFLLISPYIHHSHGFKHRDVRVIMDW